MPTVREASFAVFRHFGLDRMFGNPGSTELPMLRALPEGFAYVLGLNEAAVVGMADGFAQASKGPALVNLHSAAGTGHALGNIYTAYRNNTPLVITAGQQARAILPLDPFLGAERATEFPRPYVKWAAEPMRAEDVPAVLARAFHIALTPPMGPVFVSIPVDDWDRECTMPPLPDLSLRALPDPAGIGRLALLLDRARQPALVLGSGIARSGGWSAAIALAEACGASVWVAPFAAREVFPEDHPQFAGFLPAFRDQIVSLLAPHDAALVVGAPVFTYHAEGPGPVLPEGMALGALSEDAQHLSFLPGGMGVLGDVRSGLEQLASQVTRRAPLPAHPRPAQPAPGMTAAYVLSRLAALRPADAMLVEEAPTARAALHDNLPILCEQGFFTCASGGLGYALPAAVGVAMASGGRKVIALLGDGSTMYTLQALWSAADQGLPISFVILNNRRYAALDNFARRFGLNQMPGTELRGIDFVALSGSLGVEGRRVEAVEQLDAALEWSMACATPTLVELLIA